uniref:Primosome PriB single-strand DNA-binding domain containing protein n=1 Tax=Haemonchus contortus TaxID=6289 RepID=W6NRG3_HAECO
MENSQVIDHLLILAFSEMLRATSVVSRLASRGFSLSASRSAEQPTKKEVEALFAENPPQERRAHAYSLNRVEIIGGVANDPVFKTAKNDRPYAIVNVITNSRQRLANGEYRDQTERHTITAFGRTAEFVANNIKRGTRVLVNARLHYTGGQLDDQGVRSPRQTHLHAETIQPLARGGGGGGGSDGASESS